MVDGREKSRTVIPKHIQKDDLAARLRGPAESEMRMRKDIAWLKEAMRTLLDERGLPVPEDRPH